MRFYVAVVLLPVCVFLTNARLSGFFVRTWRRRGRRCSADNTESCVQLPSAFDLFLGGLRPHVRAGLDFSGSQHAHIVIFAQELKQSFVR